MSKPLALLFFLLPAIAFARGGGGGGHSFSGGGGHSFSGGSHSYSGGGGGGLFGSGGGYGYGGYGGYGYHRYGYYDDGYYRRGYWYHSRTNVDSSCYSVPDDPNYPFRCYSHYGGGWGMDIVLILFLVGILFSRSIWAALTAGAGSRTPGGAANDTDGDEVVHPSAAVEAKARRTRGELDQAATRNPAWRRDDMLADAKKAFFMLQTCWEKRDYTGMAPLVTPSIRATHEAQLASMKRNHEINRIKNPQIERAEVVHFVAAEDEGGCSFTVLLQARMSDYFEDDRDGKVVRGESEAHSFQEFWTFTRRGGRWLLAEIEQAKESSALQEPNRLYGVAGESHSAVLLPKVESKIAMLGMQDRRWNVNDLRAIARGAATNFFLSFEKGDLSLFEGHVESGFSERFAAAIREMQARDARVEYRNICVRAVTFTSYKNEPAVREFSVEVALHAQRVFTQKGEVKLADKDAQPFQEKFFFRDTGAGFQLFDTGRGGDEHASGVA